MQSKYGILLDLFMLGLFCLMQNANKSRRKIADVYVPQNI
jgi:hypothetical protein